MKQTKDLESLPISRLLLRFSIPAITGTVITSLYNIVDRIFLGRYVGELGIAATTIAMPMMLITMAVGMLIGFGTNSQISIRLGEKKYDEAEKLLGQGLFLFFITSLFITFGSLVFLKQLLSFFGATENVMPYASSYLGIVVIGTLPHQISFGANSFIRGEGNPKVAMATMLIGGILNVILDYIFIALLGWGMMGAAWATVIGYSVSAIWVLHYYISGKSAVKFYMKTFKMTVASTRQVILMGSPHFIMNLISSVQMSLFNNQLARFGGDMGISIMGVIMSFNLIWLMPIIGLSQGLQPIVGYNVGAKKPVRVKKALLMTLVTATLMCIFFFTMIQLFSHQIFCLFTTETESEFVVQGSHAIKRFLFLLPAIGYLIIMGNYFQFTGRPKISLALTIVRQVVFLIPFILILPKYYGIDGVWYSMPASDAGALLLTSFFFIRELKKLGQQIVNPDQT